MTTATGFDALPTCIDLSGRWQFLPGDCAFVDLPRPLPEGIDVPGLWEAQGHPRLDGAAWYRHEFQLPESESHWSLQFGAVMDAAQVYLNGIRLGEHDGAYTPFLFDATGAARPRHNTLEVRVVDHPLDSPEHRRRAHGKQGWMNQVFPSPPSLYMTYGGIWQPVVMLGHGAVRISDVFINSDPDRLLIQVTVANADTRTVSGQLRLSVFDQHLSKDVSVAAGETALVEFDLQAVTAERWTPAEPALHHATVEVLVNGDLSDRREQRFGLRTFTVAGNSFVLNGEPLAIRGALVQGFRADVLYAEGNRAQIEAEVQAAKQAGLNLLRLHIKAFDPLYLEVCDELGMLVHADIPVAEPVVHDELGDHGELAEFSRSALVEQVRRDRSHPSIVLWSAMNELGAEEQASRRTPGYEAFARMLYTALAELDPTRPIIENDWIEPDPAEVFCSPILTAHWYGRLSEHYLQALAAKVAHFSPDRPLYVSEFGDWGLPFTEDEEAGWWHSRHLSEGILASPWPGSVSDFIAGTQHYQGISDRLQGEVIRAFGAAGWCLTELTDVPHEYNGLWSLQREEKPAALAEITRLCQSVLPVVTRTDWSVEHGDAVTIAARLSNDGPAQTAADLSVQIDGIEQHREVIVVPAASCVELAPIKLLPSEQAGDVRLDLVVTGLGSSAAEVKSTNFYPLHIVTTRRFGGAGLQVIGSGEEEQSLTALGLSISPDDNDMTPLLIGENRLDAQTGPLAEAALSAGRCVVILAQQPAAAEWMPIPATATDIATEWGSTPFLFSTDDTALTSLGRRRVFTTETMSVTPDVVWTALNGSPWAPRTLVGLYKPYPGHIAGTIVGELPVRNGRLVLCQLPLIGSAQSGSAMARAVLSDLVHLSMTVTGSAEPTG